LTFLLVATVLIFLAWLLRLLKPEDAGIFSVGSMVLSFSAGLVGAVQCVLTLTGSCEAFFRMPWEMPFATFVLRIDSLSAFFLLPIFGIGAIAAVFGSEYMHSPHEKSNLSVSWSAYYLLWLSMILVVLAADGLLFMLAWEMTVVSSFFLVISGDGNRKMHAGWVYLLASHLGAGFLLVMFILLGRETGSFEFASLSKAADFSNDFRSLIFLLAVIGFGTKAGFMPLHVWLPEAHPAAPSHVSALMSGVMIKTGIYGLIRIIFSLGMPVWWWGWFLLLIGLLSGIIAIVFALAQHNLKRLLAYSSVENVGIMTAGLGIGLLAVNSGNHLVALLGFSGCLMHVLNHAVFKSLLFLGAGSVLVQTETIEIDNLGGLFKKMPWTAVSFMIGCVSICAFPPFNGFISEFMIFMAAFNAVSIADSLVAPGILVILGLSLIGGLAAACFAKAFSIVFLGNPRSYHAVDAKESGKAMRYSLAFLAISCLILSVFAPVFLSMPFAVVRSYAPLTSIDLSGFAAETARVVGIVSLCSLALLILTAISVLFRQFRLRNREIGSEATWGCGYDQPSVSMQYTGASFAQPLTELFDGVLGIKHESSGGDQYFPAKASYESHINDLFEKMLFIPAFRFISDSLHKIVWIQSGVVQLSILMIALTLFLLMIVGLF